MKQLTHGGDWAGYRAEFGRDPLDFFRPMSARWVCRKGWQRPLRQRLPRPTATPTRCVGPCVKKLAVAEGVPAEWLLCGNGAADLIFRLALAAKPRTALVTAPTFAEYATALETAGCTVERYFCGKKTILR